MRDVKQWTCAASLLALSLVSAGCADRPDASMAEDAILSDISANANNLIELRAFEKTDGIERSIEGRPIYVMEWKAIIAFVGDAWWKADDFSATKSEGEASDVWESFHAGTQGKADIKAGEKIELSGKTIFERSEKGWRVIGREITEKTIVLQDAPSGIQSPLARVKDSLGLTQSAGAVVKQFLVSVQNYDARGMAKTISLQLAQDEGFSSREELVDGILKRNKERNKGELRKQKLLEIKSETVNDGEATVQASIEVTKEGKTTTEQVKFVLIKEEGEWRIRDST